MMPYIQGDSSTVPVEYRQGYEKIIDNLFFKKGDIGYLTIDESLAKKGNPHRGNRAKHNRALHTEAGIRHGNNVWGGPCWGSSEFVKLDRDVEVLLANNIDHSCALWDAEQEKTTLDGDIGHLSHKYSYKDSTMMNVGDVYQIGIFTPHESLPMKQDSKRQFLRIISSGVHGREPYFTENYLMKQH